jgi:hypothetical protein
MKRMGEEFFRYVPDDRVEAYRSIGWFVLAPIGKLRGVESMLMEWQGSGQPRDPAANEPLHCERFHEAQGG